jgi:DNA-binding SARP family transcriptional activator/class 3 adenylate cyclase
MPELPSGTLTLLFSDLEESTRLLRTLGAGQYAQLLDAHRAIVSAAVETNGGVHVDTQGDSFFCVFRTAREAASAAAAIQRSHRDHSFPAASTVRVRIGLHTGEPAIAGERYVGLAVHRAARIMGAAHGGQILASAPAADLLTEELPPGVAVVDVGYVWLKDIERPERLYELRIEGLDADFPPPRGLEAATGVDSAEFRILGPLEVLSGGRRMTYAGDKRGALLALLLLNANRVVSTEVLIDELWDESPPRSGAKAVQVRVSQLRKALADVGLGELIVTRPPGYVIELGSDRLDLHLFERLVSESDGILTVDPERAAQLLREAIGLWRGTPLAEFASTPFARAASARLEELRMAAVERRIEADLVLGRHADLVGELEALISENPFRERLCGQLMLALYRSGRQADALETYRAARKALADELGIAPGRSLQDLERAILQHDPGLELARRPEAQVAERAVPDTPGPVRSILVAPSETTTLGRLLAVAEPLTRRPRREIIVSAFVEQGGELEATTIQLESVRARLAERAVPSRVAVFTSRERGSDLVRLAAELDVDLLVVDAPEELLADGVPPPDLAQVWREALCDVAVLFASKVPLLEGGPVVVPFGGAEHDWAAVEIGAWLASAHSLTLELLGSSAEPERGKRDASRSLAVVSLVVQRAAGISAKPVLVAPGEELMETTRGAGLLVVGLSERWSEEGIGVARLELARNAGVPTLLVRRGVRPGGLTPPERMTRYTWSFVHAGDPGAPSGG